MLDFLSLAKNFLKSIKRKGKSGLRICPRCGSAKIRAYSSFSGWLTPERYLCESCGYVGSLVFEAEEGEEEPFK